MQRLKGFLYQANPDGGLAETFPAGTARSDLPEWVKVDDGAFDEVIEIPVDAGGEPDPGDSDDPDADDGSAPSDDGERPGLNASRDKWVAYAEALGLSPIDTDTRAEIIAAVDSL